MSGNRFGQLFSVTTFGESHGPAVGCVVDGVPAGLALSEADIQPALERRRPGTSKHTSQRRETDKVQILSGVFEGKTLGTPIALLIPNVDAKSSDYDNLKEVYRPGHGDYTYQMKYGHRDHRGGGRASGRETAARVAAGAIAQKILRQHGVTVRGCLQQMGESVLERADWEAVEQNPFFCPEPAKVDLLAAEIEALRRQGDSIGSAVYVEARGVPVGLGEPVFDKLDADIAKAMMSINGVKGVAIGEGFETVTQRGSEHRDEITKTGFTSNHAGGILAGISTGQDLSVTLAIKPPSSIRIPGKTLNHQGEETTVVTTGRHDPCIGFRIVPVAEAMLAITLLDALKYTVSS